MSKTLGIIFGSLNTIILFFFVIHLFDKALLKIRKNEHVK